MKKIILTVVLVFIGIMAFANPLSPIFAMRVWFDTEGDFFVEVGMDLVQWEIPAQDFIFTTNSGSYQLPASYTPPDSACFVLNLSQLIPDFNISPQDDFFRVQQSGSSWFQEQIRWSPDSDLNIDIHPLLPGQSAVQFYYGVFDNTYQCWSKDDAVYPDEPYWPCPRSHCTFDILVQNQLSEPVSNYPVGISYETFNAGYTWYDGQQTDASGLCQMNLYPARPWIKVLDNVGNQFVVDQWYYPEPGETITLTATLSSTAADDLIAQPIPGTLTIFPNVLKLSQGTPLQIRYDKTPELTAQTELCLLDLRGRLLQKTSFARTGAQTWQLPELSSGIYFITLREGNRQLGRQKLTVFK